MESTVEQ